MTPFPSLVAAGLCLPLVAQFAGFGSPYPSPVEVNPGVDESAERNVCGPNSLYLFLSLHNVACDYSDVRKLVHVSRNGSDMLSMRNASTSLGLPSEIRSYQLRDLPRIPRPFVAHLRSRQGPSLETGWAHYIVVLDSDSKRVWALDGTSGEEVVLTTEGFGHLWSGHALVRESVSKSLISVVLIVSLASVLALVTRRILRSRRSPLSVQALPSNVNSDGTNCRQGQSVVAPNLLVFLLISGVASFCAHCELTAGDGSPWRTPASARANSLYLFLRLNGARTSYSEVDDFFSSENVSPGLLGIREGADAFGRRTEIRAWSFEELASGPLPVIAYTDSATGEPGDFVVILSVSRQRVLLIDGGFLKLREIGTEHFRRRWPGYVLASRPSIITAPGDWIAIVCVVIPGGLLGFYLRMRWARSRLKVSNAPLATVAQQDEALLTL